MQSRSFPPRLFLRSLHAVCAPFVCTSCGIGGELLHTLIRIRSPKLALFSLPEGSELAGQQLRHKHRKMISMQLEDTIQVEPLRCRMERWQFEGVSSPLSWGGLVSYPSQVKYAHGLIKSTASVSSSMHRQSAEHNGLCRRGLDPELDDVHAEAFWPRHVTPI